MGRIAAHAPVKFARATPKPVDRAGGEAMRKACGVLMAMLPGKSWAPHPPIGQAVNVGTVLGLPSPPASQAGNGQARRQLSARDRAEPSQ